MLLTDCGIFNDHISCCSHWDILPGLQWCEGRFLERSLQFLWQVLRQSEVGSDFTRDHILLLLCFIRYFSFQSI